MKRIILVDLDNSIANVNGELQKRGYSTDVYPSPIPSCIFNDESIYRNARPIGSVIDTIKELNREGQDMFLFFTARSSEKHIHVTTQEWLVKNTPFTFPMFYTKGIPKGNLIKSIYSFKTMRDYEWVVLDDAPHEIMSYLNLKNEANIKMDFYIPDWSYNRHIDFGKRIAV